MARIAQRLAVVALTAVVVVACGDDDETSTTETFEIGSPASVQSTVPVTAFPTVATIAPITADTTDIPFTVPGTGDIPVVPDTADAPVLVDVVVGEGTGEDRIESVPFGATVVISIVNPDEHDEYHIHGYDLGDGMEFDAGETATFTFTATMSGDFEVESHSTDDVIFILRVG